MAAYDNVSLAGPPNIATAGNYAQMLMQGLSQLGKDYQSGQEFNYQQQQRNLFQNGIPTNAQGQPDFYGMLQKMIQAGGSPVAAQTLPLLQAQAGQTVANNAFTGGDQPVNTSPQASTAAGSPASITGQFSPRQPTQTASTEGGDTINSLAAERHVDLDAFLGKYPGFRSLLNRDLTPSQAQAVTQRMAGFGGGGTSPQPNPVPQSGLQDEGNVNQQVPTGSAGGSGPISPAPTSASGNIGGAPSGGASFSDRFGASGGRQPLQVTVPIGGSRPVQTTQAEPAGMPSLSDIQRYEARGNGKLQAATSPMVNKEQATALRDAGNKDLEVAKQLREERFKALGLEPTTTQKDVASGAAARAEEQKGEIASGQKDLDKINTLGDKYRISNQKLQLAKSFVNSDEYYSGPLEGINRRLKQYLAIPGDPNKALSQEAMVKSVNDLLSEQIQGMAASGVGRILLAEVNTMKDSIASQKITPATNRLLLEEIDRVHKAGMDIQDAANVYVQQHGHLDAGFHKQVADYYRDPKHRLFSDAELHDPRLIAPPVAPPGMDPVRAKLWAKSRGLNPGDPVRTQDGRIVGAP